MSDETVPIPFDASAAELLRRGERELAAAEAEHRRLRGQGSPPSVATLQRPLDRLLLRLGNLASHGRFLEHLHPDGELRAGGRALSERADRIAQEVLSDPDLLTALRRVEVAAEDGPTGFARSKMIATMVRSGAELDPPRRREAGELALRKDALAKDFLANVARSRPQVVVEDLRELEGLPPGFLAEHPPDADGRVRLSFGGNLESTILGKAPSSELRRRVYLAAGRRGFPENSPIAREALALQHRRALLLGFRSFAEFDLATQMLSDPGAVRAMLREVEAPLRATALADAERLLARKRRDLPEAARLENWDERYYSQRLASEVTGVELSRLEEYFTYGGVRDGLFRLCRELFGLDFVARPELPVWDPTVEAFEVVRDGEPWGEAYLDSVARDSKLGGGYLVPLRHGVREVQRPVGVLVMPIVPKGVARDTFPLAHSKIVGFFHEFGHLVHHLLAGGGRWGCNTFEGLERDFIEGPSVLFEEWAWDPSVLRRLGGGAPGGKAPPEELLAALARSRALGRGERWLYGAALADAVLRLTSTEAPALDPEEVVRASVAKIFTRPLDAESRITCAWPQLVTYGASYYTYLWCRILAQELVAPFERAGSLTDPTWARAYAREILEAGASRPAFASVRAYLGREPNAAAFLAWVAAPGPGAAAEGPTGHREGPK